MLVDVPISVHTPPNIEANESGINSFEGLTFVSRATPSTIGKKIATAAVLLMKADIAPIISIVVTTDSQKLCLPIVTSAEPKKLTAPVLNNPALRTNIAPTVTVAVLLKPEIPSSGEMVLLNNSAAMTKSAIKSTGSFSVAKRTTAATRITSTIAISIVIDFSGFTTPGFVLVALPISE